MPASEYYDIVIFGYLKAVRDYLTKAHLKKYRFSTIAWHSMSHSLFYHYKRQYSQKQEATLVSIHSPPQNGGLPLEETIEAPNDPMEQAEVRLLLHSLAKRVSRQQMALVRLRCSGYSIPDISRKQKISIYKVKKMLEDISSVLKKLCSK